MAKFTNAQILSAVLSKWGQPIVEVFAGSKLMSLPMLANIEAKIKSTGWVSPMWSLGKELSPMLGGMANRLIEPMLANYLNGVPDAMIPQMAHSFVENAIANGGVSLFEGKIELELEDLRELQTLLRYNLPITESESYPVVTEMPKPQGEVVEINQPI